ncbi:MAG: hypothetical protein Q4D33_09965 [Prevotellaceae bacterium]|nr:hypothetical protein [Prevotellaceae bacterium]
MDDEASEREYYILISDWNGRYILPKNWFRMKSWTNGKAVYRKGMKPKK